MTNMHPELAVKLDIDLCLRDGGREKVSLYLEQHIDNTLYEDREMLMPPSFYREYVDPISTALNHA